ncbi:TcaA NTF2-like domain-containing protein [Romboutsia hominis]|uniref:Invasin/intimin cell-adhesion n=1 Tax=Romboutsia hominis TaxID=1507512 RepID=A0A2P2BVW1_9FIRM|nr:hypothetical protein [Romboutsia hominis]CEI73354.1 Invasin/intimin cell-adhesion [Romboutsia hominis]
MGNNLTEKELIEKINSIWIKNKKSEDVINCCETLFNQTNDINIDIYIIYLNTLVNLKKYSKAFEVIDNNKQLGKMNEIISFKMKLLFFLNRYEELEKYISNVELDEDNEKLAQKILSQIKPKQKTNKPQEIKDKSVVNENTVDKKDKVIEKSKLVKEQPRFKEVKVTNEVKIEREQPTVKESNIISEYKIANETPKVDSKEVKDNNKTKNKFKIILPTLVIVLLVVGGSIFILNKKDSDVVINTVLNLSNQEEIKQYQSGQESISYELPIGKEFEFISSANSSTDKELYVTYNVSDENIATITEDGFFKGKKAGTVDVLTLNKNKVVNTIKVKVVKAQVILEDETTYDVLPTDEIREVLKNYEKDYIQAVNEGNYSLVEKYLVKGGPLDKEHKTNIKKFYDDGIREELKSFEFISIDEISNGEYIVNVNETIAITKNGEKKVKQFDSFYNVKLQDNGEYLIYEMQINEINEEIDKKLSVEEAIEFCTNRLKEIDWYNDTYGQGEYYGTSEEEGSRGYYYIIYECGESFYVNPEKMEVYYIAPAGDGFSAAL